MRLVKLFVLAISCCLLGGCQSSIFAQCLFSQPDERSFGSALAMNDNYLAVGDSSTNKVIIYNLNRVRKWERFQEITPPLNSDIYHRGHGFGLSLALDKNIIYITAFSQAKRTKSKNFIRLTKLKPIKSIYKVEIGNNNQAKKININDGEEIFPYFIAAEKEKLFFLTKDKKISSAIKTKVNAFSEKKNYLLGELITNDINDFYEFVDIDVKNDLLVIGKPSNKEIGGALIFDLNNLEKEPKLITIPNTFLGTAVEISEQFVVVGDLFGGRFIKPNNYPSVTLIQSLNSGKSTIINGSGKLSLDENILAKLSYKKPGIVNSETILNVFRIDNNLNIYRLLTWKNKHLRNILVYKNKLITVQRHNKLDRKICIRNI